MCSKKELNKKAINIAKAFYEMTGEKTTPALFKRTIGQAKSLLETSTEEELLEIIEYLKTRRDLSVYSLGYLSFNINRIIKDMKLEKIKAKEIKTEEDTLEIALEDNENKKKSSLYLNSYF